MKLSKFLSAAALSLAPTLGFAQESAPKTPEDFTTHRIETTPGVNLFVREAGEGEALVLLHGWPQNGLKWHTVEARRAFMQATAARRCPGQSASTDGPAS